MQVVQGVDELRPQLGPIFVVVGVFDGLHLGHAYLLEHLVAASAARDARPTVITFDQHPDAVLTGVAPPLLLDPAERLERLAAAGVAVTVVQTFDEALRRMPYDAFVQAIRARVELRGFLMTPDAAFGFERPGRRPLWPTSGRAMASISWWFPRSASTARTFAARPSGRRSPRAISRSRVGFSDGQ